MKQTFLKTAKALGLFAAARRATAGQLRILCYHGIWTAPQPHYGDYLFMNPQTFARRMVVLAERRYPVLPLGEAVQRLYDGTLPPAAVAITIDDGWYGTYRHMLPVLEKHGFPATIYATTHYIVKQRPVLNILIGYMTARAPAADIALRDLFPEHDSGEVIRLNCAASRAGLAERLYTWFEALPDVEARWTDLQRIARLLRFDLEPVLGSRAFDLMTPDELRDAHARGFDIQLHTHRHRLHGFDHAKVVSEIEENRAHLSDILRVAPGTLTRFCYPSGNWSASIFPALRQAGIAQATTTGFGLNDQTSDPLALSRVLDGQSLTDLDFEARLSGFWSLIEGVKAKRAAIRRGGLREAAV